MTGVSAKRATLAHVYVITLLPLKRGVRLLVIDRRGLRGGRGMLEDPWRTGEHPTFLVNL